MSKIERLAYPSGLEVRAHRDNGSGPKQIAGRIPFNSRSADLGGFIEVIRPGAFKGSLEAGADVRAMVNHNQDRLLGRTKAGTLHLSESDQGLEVLIDTPDTSVGRDALLQVERRDLDGMSFSFRTVNDRWSVQDGVNFRELLEVDINDGDVGPVAFPAYEQSQASLRSAAAIHGIELDKLLPVLVRFERGLEVSGGDRAAVERAITQLRQITTPKTDERHVPLDVLRRRLDLAEAQL